MKNLKRKSMKNLSYLLCFSVLVVITFFVTSCSSDTNDIPPESRSGENQITEFTLSTQQDGVTVKIEGTIDTDTKEIQVILPLDLDINNSVLMPEVTISENARIITPTSLENLDFSEPILFVIEAENGMRTTYTVVTIGKENNTMITAFVVTASGNETFQTDIVGTIDQKNNQIAITLPDVDLSNVKVDIKSPEGSSTNLGEESRLDFTKETVAFTVTAADGITTATYAVDVSLEENQSRLLEIQFLAIENSVLNFDVAGIIDEVNQSITITLPQDVDPTELIPTTRGIEGATIEKVIEESRVQFKVTSADGNTVSFYELQVETFTDRMVLEAIFEANPTSEIDWPVTNDTSDIGSWSGVTVRDGRVLQLEKDKLLILPKEIQYLSALQELNLNYSFLESLPEELRYVQTLTSISLIANNLRTLPDWFSEFANLNAIDLSRNKLNAFPEVILSLTQLKTLLIRFNRGLSELPEDMSGFSELQVLDVSGNSLRSIPSGIKDVVKARRLNFSNNSITAVPKEIADLGGLNLLDLRNNRSLTTVPAEICALQTIPGFLLSLDTGVCP